MSLTALLDAPDVRARFKSEFRRPRRAWPKRMRARRRLPAERASQLGMAFDYLLRFELERRHPDLTSSRPWEAERGLRIVEGLLHPRSGKVDGRAIRRATRFLREAKQEHAAYLKTGELTDELLESVWRLAYLERFYRVPPTSIATAPINLLERKEVRLGVGAQELRALLRAVPFKRGFTPARRILLNPDFGDASRMIGGADADIILDDTVIDIKTTVDPKVYRDDFNQVIGYAALAELGGLSGEPPQRLERFQVYLSRYATLHTYERAEVIDETRWPAFLAWLAERSRKAFPSREDAADRVLAAHAQRHPNAATTMQDAE